MKRGGSRGRFPAQGRSSSQGRFPAQGRFPRGAKGPTPRREPPAPPPPLELSLAAGEAIELGALLKVAGLCGTGGEAKHLVQTGHVLVDGVVETRRGRKLRGGEVVAAKGRRILVRAAG